MTYMLCRNRVADFARWKAIFSAHARAHSDAGLHLVKIWRALDEPNTIFFLFEVGSVEKAQQFISNAEAARAAESSGVMEGEYHFLEDAGGY